MSESRETLTFHLYAALEEGIKLKADRNVGRLGEEAGEAAGIQTC